MAFEWLAINRPLEVLERRPKRGWAEVREIEHDSDFVHQSQELGAQ
jgi:hypothetical protein